MVLRLMGASPITTSFTGMRLGTGRSPRAGYQPAGNYALRRVVYQSESDGSTPPYAQVMASCIRRHDLGRLYSGNFSASGTITGSDCIASDERLKDNITTAPVGLYISRVGSGTGRTRVLTALVWSLGSLRGFPHLVHEMARA